MKYSKIGKWTSLAAKSFSDGSSFPRINTSLYGSKYTPLFHSSYNPLQTFQQTRGFFFKANNSKDEQTKFYSLLIEYSVLRDELTNLAFEKDFGSMLVAYNIFRSEALFKSDGREEELEKEKKLLEAILKHPTPKGALYFQSGLSEDKTFNNLIELINKVDKADTKIMDKYSSLKKLYIANAVSFNLTLTSGEIAPDEAIKSCEERLKKLTTILSAPQKEAQLLILKMAMEDIRSKEGFSR
jgi:hypothetical protein